MKNEYIEHGWLFTQFERMGLVSLEIYILHPFILPKLPFFESLFECLDLYSSIVAQFCVSLIISLLIILFCIALALFPKSPLRKILLGK